MKHLLPFLLLTSLSAHAKGLSAAAALSRVDSRWGVHYTGEVVSLRAWLDPEAGCVAWMAQFGIANTEASLADCLSMVAMAGPNDSLDLTFVADDGTKLRARLGRLYYTEGKLTQYEGDLPLPLHLPPGAYRLKVSDDTLPSLLASPIVTDGIDVRSDHAADRTPPEILAVQLSSSANTAGQFGLRVWAADDATDVVRGVASFYRRKDIPYIMAEVEYLAPLHCTPCGDADGKRVSLCVADRPAVDGVVPWAAGAEAWTYDLRYVDLYDEAEHWSSVDLMTAFATTPELAKVEVTVDGSAADFGPVLSALGVPTTAPSICAPPTTVAAESTSPVPDSTPPTAAPPLPAPVYASTETRIVAPSTSAGACQSTSSAPGVPWVLALTLMALCVARRRTTGS